MKKGWEEWAKKDIYWAQSLKEKEFGLDQYVKKSLLHAVDSKLEEYKALGRRKMQLIDDLCK